MTIVPSDITVIIPVYTMDRWALTCDAVESVLAQSLAPDEIIICVDHNADLMQRLRERFPPDQYTNPPVRIIESRHDGHVSASRTTAVEAARSQTLVFLDDDAVAEPGWLERMSEPLRDPDIVAVGGEPLPIFPKPRPRWFPPEFDWIFGCAYTGLPRTPTPTLRLIGTTIAARRDDLIAIDGFHFDVFEDLAMCHHLLALKPSGTLLYEPRAVVMHYVHPNRLTWHYYWYRCFWVNRGKVAVMKQLGESAANLRADRRFVAHSLGTGLAREARQLVRGDAGGALRAGAICAGLLSAAAGYLVGTVQWKLHSTSSRPTGRTPGSAREARPDALTSEPLPE